jgi:hypothetical protein
VVGIPPGGITSVGSRTNAIAYCPPAVDGIPGVALNDIRFHLIRWYLVVVLSNRGVIRAFIGMSTSTVPGDIFSEIV